MTPAIDLKNVEKHYSGFYLDNVSFTLPRGYIMGLIGPNGAGKSTIIKLIMNLVRRESGAISIFGREIRDNEVETKQKIGFVPDEPHFHDDVSLKNIKSAFSHFYSRWDDGLFDELMEEFELPANKTPKKLSSGMRAKFACALALSHQPDVLVLDEPTSGLDPVFRRKLLKKLATFIQDGQKSVLLSTHITSDLESIADYVTFINRGRIVFSETLEKVKETWAVVKGEEAVLSSEDSQVLSGLRTGSFGAQAITKDVRRLGRQVLESCVVERASLEDIMYFVKKDGRHDQSYSAE